MPRIFVFSRDYHAALAGLRPSNVQGLSDFAYTTLAGCILPGIDSLADCILQVIDSLVNFKLQRIAEEVFKNLFCTKKVSIYVFFVRKSNC